MTIIKFVYRQAQILSIIALCLLTKQYNHTLKIIFKVHNLWFYSFYFFLQTIFTQFFHCIYYSFAKFFILINNKNMWLGLTTQLKEQTSLEQFPCFFINILLLFVLIIQYFKHLQYQVQKLKMENVKILWFETQQNFKLLTISIIISKNYLSFFVC